MKRFLLLISFFSFLFVGLNAQVWQVTEDLTSIICDTNLTGGVSADTIYSCQAPSNGTLVLNGLCASYTPSPNYFGYDQICLTTCIAGICEDSTIQITINPVGESIYQNTPEEVNVSVCEAIISGGNNVIISACSAPLFGTAFYNPLCAIYQPLANFIGADSFCIVSCIDTLCDTSNLVINVTPVADVRTATVAGNASVTICTPTIPTVVDSVTSFTLSCGPTQNNGTVVVNSVTQCVTYTPSAAFDGTGLTGTDVICISICNSAGVCDVTNINITITGFTLVNNFNATQLAESLAGSGVTISNAILNCPNTASGIFSNAPNALGLEDGIVLTCGSVLDVRNANAGVNASSSNNAPGDFDLTALIAATNPNLVSTDACVLEFDAEVLGDSLTFNYVFGSEEYNEYVCSNFNDVFGFFVTGANPSGPAYVRQNVALIPGTTTAVAINSVNNGNVGASGMASTPGCNIGNAAFFNGVVPSIVYDGNTVALRSKINTVPCTIYNFKLGVADGTPTGSNDQSFDSGVFIEAGSFTSLPVTLASSTVLGSGFVNAVEGCVDGRFSFELNQALNIDYGIKFLISGTANNGVDYILIEDSITFFAGDTVVDVFISPINDALTEGNETVKLYLLNPCTNLPFDSAELNIIDLIPFNLNVSKDTICPGETITFNATIAGDDNNLAVYSWTPNNGTVLDLDSGFTLVIPSITQDYYVDYTLGNCTRTDTTSIFVSTFSMAYDTNFISCPGANDGGFIALDSNAIGGVTYEWLPSMSVDSFINGLGTDTVFVTTTDQSGLACGLITDTLFLTEPTGLNFDYDTINISCFGLDDGTLNIASLAPNTLYTFDVVFMGNSLPQQSFTTDANGDFSITNLPSGLYDSILISNPGTGCFNSLGFNIEEPDSLIADIVTPGTVLCSGGTIDSLSVNVIGGTAPYSYLWNTLQVTQTITGLVTGTYSVLITDFNNCQASDTFIVAQPNPLAFALLADSVSCFGGSNGSAYIDTLGGGTSPYTFSWDAAAGSQTNDTAFNLVVGTYMLTVTDFNGCQEQESVTIEQADEILLTEIHTDVSCIGGNTASIDVTVSGGLLPYTYSWAGPNGFTASSQDLLGLAAGSYLLTTTDFLSCSKDITVLIVNSLALSVILDSTNISCNNLNDGTASVNVSGGTTPYTYLWNDPLAQTVNTATGLAAGTYQIFVTDFNGCRDTTQVNLTEPDSLLLNIDNVGNFLCNGANAGSISVSTSGGTAPYTYIWTNGGGSNEDLSNVSAGSYTLTVTDINACSDQITQILIEPTAVVVNLQGINISCFGGSDGAISAAVSGGVNPYTYAWIGPNGFTASTQDITALSAGTYTLLTTDSNSCINTQTLTIAQPAAVVMNFLGVDVNCFGGNDGSLTVNVQTGGAGPFQYQWSASANSQTGFTAVGLVSGAYTVTITDNNGCIYVDSASITQPLTPLTLLVNGTDITCAGLNNGIALAVAQGGTPGYSYLWNDAQAQATNPAINLPSNTYQVTVTDANGCSAADTTFINEPNPINVVITSDSVNCWGAASGSINVFASGGSGVGYVFSIDGGANFQSSQDFLNLPAGVYNEIVVQDLGSSDLCLSATNVTTVFEQPYFSFEVSPSDTSLQLEETVTLNLEVTSSSYGNSSIVSASWNPSSGLNCNDCINPTVLTYENYTDYQVTVNYEGGDGELCSANANTIIIVENNLELFIPNAFTPGGFDNMNNVFEVYGEGIEYITMQVFNRWGEKVFESRNQSVAWDGSFKGEIQNPGVFTYYVKVEYLDGKAIDRKGSVTLIR
jgi:gliding motility-associated-like protein